MRRLKKRLVAIVALFTLVLVMAVPSFAAESESAENVSVEQDVVARAGEETWTGSGAGGAFRFTDNNITPTKTMGQSGTLLITGSFYGTDGYADSVPIKLTFQIQNSTGTRVLASTVVNDNRSGYIPFAVSCHVNKGDKIRLFMDASSISNPPGILRSAYIEYDYFIN